MSKEEQKYEIYINGKVLVLLHDELLSSWNGEANQLVMPYRGNKKSLFQYLDILESSERFASVVLYAADVGGLFKDLKSLLEKIPAAGGLIINDEGKILMMFRRGFWDLPKGKLDREELWEDAAVRECLEETGLQQISMISKFGTTWHMYREKKGQRALKKTKWYIMRAEGNQSLLPQKEEGIEELLWLPLDDAKKLKPIHQSLMPLLEKFSDLSFSERQYKSAD